MRYLICSRFLRNSSAIPPITSISVKVKKKALLFPFEQLPMKWRVDIVEFKLVCKARFFWLGLTMKSRITKWFKLTRFYYRTSRNMALQFTMTFRHYTGMTHMQNAFGSVGRLPRVSDTESQYSSPRAQPMNLQATCSRVMWESNDLDDRVLTHHQENNLRN